MKIRIRGNSVRLRLQKQEVKTLQDVGHVSESTPMGSRVFKYSIESDRRIAQLQAVFDEEGIRVLAPAHSILGWAQSEELSIYGEQNSEGGLLKILVEKDLMCIKPRSSPLWEDESDAYPNSNTSCGGGTLDCP